MMHKTRQNIKSKLKEIQRKKVRKRSLKIHLTKQKVFVKKITDALSCIYICSFMFLLLCINSPTLQQPSPARLSIPVCSSLGASIASMPYWC